MEKPIIRYRWREGGSGLRKKRREREDVFEWCLGSKVSADAETSFKEGTNFVQIEWCSIEKSFVGAWISSCAGKIFKKGAQQL